VERWQNPYTPNAGAKPPVLVGREDELESFETLLRRLGVGRTEKSLIAVGLRGVGKTVLLGEFRQRALDADWQVVEVEVTKCRLCMGRTANWFSEGYPYFLQEFGEAAWDLATDRRITESDARTAVVAVEEKLDTGFFKVRLDRTTELQRAYLRAMAELGAEPQLASDVAVLLNRSSSQCGTTRKQLVDKGLLYATEHGYAAFTVPKFDEYLKRAIPDLEPPTIRQRQSRSASAG